jgi:hypothetical protein
MNNKKPFGGQLLDILNKLSDDDVKTHYKYNPKLWEDEMLKRKLPIKRMLSIVKTVKETK